MKRIEKYYAVFVEIFVVAKTKTMFYLSKCFGYTIYQAASLCFLVIHKQAVQLFGS